MRVRKSKFLALILLAFFISACSSDKWIATSPSAPRNDKVLNLSIRGSDPKTLNPWIASDATSSMLGTILFDGLIKVDPNTDEVKPHMAESLQILDAGKTIIVKLRDDIYWNDGEKITSADVIYTWNDLIRDGIAVSSLPDVLKVDGKFPQVTALDERTIQFKTETVFAPFLKLMGVEIAPKHHIESFFKKQNAKSFEEKQQAFNSYLSVNSKPEEIVSSGPFKFSKVKSGQRIEFIKNPSYFLKDDKGKQYPYLDKVVFVYTQDDSAETFKFLAGEVHAINVSPQNAGFIKSLEKKYNFTVYDLGSSTSTNFLWFNLSHNVPEPQYSWFNNGYFRKAINYAIDRESIINNVFQGFGKALYTAESLRSPFLNENIGKDFKRDLPKAKELLKQGGFKFNAKNQLLDSKGNRVEFNMITNAGNVERELTSVIIIDNLKELGIKVNFKLIEFNNFVGKTMQGKDYEAGILSLTGGNEPNGGANVWKSDGRLHLFDIKNSQKNPITRDWEKEIDNLFNQGVQYMDFAKRKSIYDKFQEIVFEENPLIYIASPKIIMAISNRIKGIQITKYGTPLDEIYKLDIESKNN